MLRPVAFVLLVEVIRLTYIRVLVSYSKYFTFIRDKVLKKDHFEQVNLRNQPSQIQKQKLTRTSLLLPGQKLRPRAVIAALNTVWNGGNNP